MYSCILKKVLFFPICVFYCTGQKSVLVISPVSMKMSHLILFSVSVVTSLRVVSVVFQLVNPL